MKNIQINSTGFDNMMRVMQKKTGATYKDVLKASAGSILEGAARKTGASKAKIVSAAIQKSFSTRFVSSSGDKIRKAKDGSLIFKERGSKAGRWIRIRNSYTLNAVGAKNPSGRPLGKELQKRANKALAELRKLQNTIIAVKKARIASSKASFLYIMRQLKITIKSTRGLGAALKATITAQHGSALSGKLSIDKYGCSIIIKSKSKSALNPHSRGIQSFGAAFNGQVKAFETASKKDLKEYAKQFASRNGFTVK
jgi:hypothetical protein